MARLILILNYFIVYTNANKVIDCPTNRDCTTLCQENNSCQDTIINCPSNRYCHIECSNISSCKGATINAANNQPLLVNCHGEMSCYNTSFHATEASMLNIFGCTSHQSCLDLSIYCPPNSNGIQNCFISGNNNLAASNQSNSNGINIYAINGWNDIIINYNGSFNAAHIGAMHCTKTFSTSCDIAYNAWSCMNPINKCNNQIANMHQISSTILTSETSETFTIDTSKLHMVNSDNGTKIKISIVFFILSIIGIFLFLMSITICAAFCLYVYFVKKSQKLPVSPKMKHILHVSTESNISRSRGPSISNPNIIQKSHTIDIGSLQHIENNLPQLPVEKMVYHLSIPSVVRKHSINYNVQRKSQSQSHHVDESEREFSLDDVDLEKDLPLSPKKEKKVECWTAHAANGHSEINIEMNNEEDRSSDSDMYIQSNQPEGTPECTPKHSPVIRPMRMSIDIATDVSFGISASYKK